MAIDDVYLNVVDDGNEFVDIGDLLIHERLQVLSTLYQPATPINQGAISRIFRALRMAVVRENLHAMLSLAESFDKISSLDILYHTKRKVKSVHNI
jgi:hypothetical protein